MFSNYPGNTQSRRDWFVKANRKGKLVVFRAKFRERFRASLLKCQRITIERLISANSIVNPNEGMTIGLRLNSCFALCYRFLARESRASSSTQPARGNLEPGSPTQKLDSLSNKSSSLIDRGRSLPRISCSIPKRWDACADTIWWHTDRS